MTEEPTRQAGKRQHLVDVTLAAHQICRRCFYTLTARAYGLSVWRRAEDFSIFVKNHDPTFFG